MTITLSISPHGAPFVEAAPDPEAPGLEEAAAKRIRAAFAEGPSQGLLHLGTAELQTSLPPALGFARDLARAYLTRLCHTPGLDGTAEVAPVPAPGTDELAAMALQAPPMKGLEYLNADALARWWVELDARVRAEAREFTGGVQAYLREKSPLWRMVGRVTFHL